MITLAHAHQADRLSVASLVLSVAVLSLVATAAAQARPGRRNLEQGLRRHRAVVVATWGRA